MHYTVFVQLFNLVHLVQLLIHFIPLSLVVCDLLVNLIQFVNKPLPSVQVLHNELVNCYPTVPISVNHVINLLSYLWVKLTVLTPHFQEVLEFF